MNLAMTMVGEQISQPAKEAMEQASFLWDMEDAAARHLAVGSAVQAAHQAALVLVAAAGADMDVERHPFAAKFRLFEFGRWPVGVAGRSFNLF